MFLNISFSLNSFQITPHVSIIYLKHYDVKKLKTCDISTILTQKHEKVNINYVSCYSYYCGWTHYFWLANYDGSPIEKMQRVEQRWIK